MDKKRKLVVIFPGVNYSIDKPFLYYYGLKYASMRYDRIDILYEVDKNKFQAEDALNQVKAQVLEQAEKIPFEEYEEVVFVSKSFGTYVAGWLADTCSLKVKQLFLTPLPETFPYIKGDDSVIATVIGVNDYFTDAQALQEICEKEGVLCLTVPEVGHRLEHPTDFNRNYEILKMVTDLI